MREKVGEKRLRRFAISTGTNKPAPSSSANTKGTGKAAEAVAEQGISPNSVRAATSSHIPLNQGNSSAYASTIDAAWARRQGVVDALKHALAEITNLRAKQYIMEERAEPAQAINKLIQSILALRTKALKLSLEIGMHDEALCSALQEREAVVCAQLSTADKREQTLPLTNELHEIRAKLLQIANAQLERLADLKFKVETTPPKAASKRNYNAWAYIHRVIKEVSIPSDARKEPELQQVSLALSLFIEPGDAMQDFLDLVIRFALACANRETEIGVLLELVQQAQRLPAQAKLLQWLTKGIKLDLGNQPGHPGLCMQQALDTISAQLKLIQAEPKGAELFARLIASHAKTLDFKVHPERTRSAVRGARQDELSSMHAFLSQFVAYGQSEAAAGIARSTGEACAQEVLEHIDGADALMEATKKKYPEGAKIWDKWKKPLQIMLDTQPEQRAQARADLIRMRDQTDAQSRRDLQTLFSFIQEYLQTAQQLQSNSSNSSDASLPGELVRMRALYELLLED